MPRMRRHLQMHHTHQSKTNNPQPNLLHPLRILLRNMRQHNNKDNMTTIQLNLHGQPTYNATCKYCGKPYTKSRKHRKYCSNQCYHYARLEQKAKYQRKRRKLIKEKILISNENNFLGTTFLSQHRQNNFEDEYNSIQKELRRISLKTNTHLNKPSTPTTNTTPTKS